jgi:CheY-like chemotaxis protein
MNLVTNAAEAMNGAPGAILVRVGVEGVTEEQAASLRGSLGQAGEYACIEVRDSGQGMPPGILDRIFDPFFSTKVAGRGLGLAAVMGIVRSLGGAIGVHSREGLGTVFRVYLPRSAPAPAGEPAGRDAAGTARAGGLRVLVVDDEPLVRTVAVTALRAEGCDADTATSGEEAVECIAISPRAYDAVLLDLTMPGMGGLAALRRIRDAAPDLPIVLTSGVTPDGDAAEALALPSVRFLAKPYDVVELSAAIRSAAGEAAPASG